MQQRLFEITYLLTERGAITAGELAQRFGVSRRTIYRDIDALSLAGIPVYAEKGKGGGIRMLPEFVLDKSVFSRQEQAELVSHFQSLATLGTPDTEPLLDKLAALFGRGDSWLEVDFAPWDGGKETREYFRLFRDAILRRNVVKFHYNGATGGQALREVEPLRVMFRGQGWYLYGFCRMRQDYRYFKLTRIRSPETIGEHFVRQAPENPATEPYTGPAEIVTLRFDAEAAFRVYDEFPREAIKEQADGSFLVTSQLPCGEWMYGYLLSFGPSAQVVSPASLRREITEKLDEMRERYREGRPKP